MRPFVELGVLLARIIQALVAFAVGGDDEVAIVLDLSSAREDSLGGEEASRRSCCCESGARNSAVQQGEGRRRRRKRLCSNLLVFRADCRVEQVDRNVPVLH